MNSQRQTVRRTEEVRVTNAETKSYEMKNDNVVRVAYIAARRSTHIETNDSFYCRRAKCRTLYRQ